MITRLVSYYKKITLYQTQTAYLWRRPWLCGSWWPTGLGGGGRGPDMHCQCWHRHRTLVPCVLSARIKWVFVSLQTFGEPLIKTACTLYCDASSRGVSFNEAISDVDMCFFWALIWYWDHLKNFIAEIPQGPLEMSIGTIWVTQKRSQGPPARGFWLF